MATRSAVFLALVILFLAATSVAHAGSAYQDPEPTPTATPAYISEQQLAPGVSLVVERRITYGEIAVVITGAMILIALILAFLIQWSAKWLR